MEVVWVILLVACQIQHARSQATVDFNPQENIPGIGALIGGNDEKPILDRWQFWLGIGLAAAFFIVLVYFVVRGFKTYKKTKRRTDAAAAVGARTRKSKSITTRYRKPSSFSNYRIYAKVPKANQRR
ncbi:hypothetical protein Ndes2526B_g06973 [Nannochloris sp. 'desiccata']